MTLNINYRTTNPREVDITLAQELIRLNNAVAVVPQEATAAAIQALVDELFAAGGGVIRLEAKDYTFTTGVQLKNGVSIIGVPGTMSFAGNVPDELWQVTGGTRIIASPGVKAFYFNNTPNVSIPANVAVGAIGNFTVGNFTVIGGARAIDTGADKAIGVQWCVFTNIHAIDQTEENYHFENFMHCEFNNLYFKQNGTNLGGMFFIASLGSTLLPGNSSVTGELYGHGTEWLNRGIHILGLGGQLNEFSLAAARIQYNRHGLASPADIVMSATNTSANFVVADNAQFALCQVGMPVAIIQGGTSVAGVTAGITYFISSRDAGTNTITLNEFPYKTTSNLVASATSSVTVKLGGFPGFAVCGNDTGSVTAGDYGSLDIECLANTSSIVFRNAKGRCKLLEAMPSATKTLITFRNSSIGFYYFDTLHVTNDVSTNQGAPQIVSESGGGFQHSSGNITLDAGWNGRKVRYSGASDITVTVPRDLPRDFYVSFTGTSTGQITWVAGTGAVFFNRSATAKTTGANHFSELQFISLSSGGTGFNLRGDLGGV